LIADIADLPIAGDGGKSRARSLVCLGFVIGAGLSGGVVGRDVYSKLAAAV
jgi:hypothetical protein